MLRIGGFMPKNEVPCRTLVITNYKRAQLYHHFPLYFFEKNSKYDQSYYRFCVQNISYFVTNMDIYRMYNAWHHFSVNYSCFMHFFINKRQTMHVITEKLYIFCFGGVCRRLWFLRILIKKTKWLPKWPLSFVKSGNYSYLVIKTSNIV